MAELSATFVTAEQKPWEPGLYEVNVSVKQRWSFWDGTRWGWRQFNREDAYRNRDKPASGPVHTWRGLAEKPQ